MKNAASRNDSEVRNKRYVSTYDTTGWRPTCNHYPRADEWLEYPARKQHEPDEVYEARLQTIRELHAELLPLWVDYELDAAIVLDPFAGTGTVGAVCRETGRRSVCLDLSGHYLRDFALPRAEHKQTEASMAALPLFAMKATN